MDKKMIGAWQFWRMVRMYLAGLFIAYAIIVVLRFACVAFYGEGHGMVSIRYLDWPWTLWFMVVR
jgi:hypothetical protein